MAVRELSRDPAKNERRFIDELPDGEQAHLDLDDDTGILTCHRCRTKQDIAFHCIHIERVRDSIYR